MVDCHRGFCFEKPCFVLTKRRFSYIMNLWYKIRGGRFCCFPNRGVCCGRCRRMRTKRITAIMSIIAVLTVFSASSGITALSTSCESAHYENSRSDSMSATKPDSKANAGVGGGTDCALRNVPEPHDFVWNSTLPGAAFRCGADKLRCEPVQEPAAQSAFSAFMCSILRRAP